jgi:hypothetical protein
LAGYLLLALALPAWIAAMRLRGPPDRRLLGAWRRLEIELSVLGVAALPSATAPEVACLVRDRLGPLAGEAARDMAEAVDAYAFGARPPTTLEADLCVQRLKRIRKAAKDVHRESPRSRGRHLIARVRISTVVAAIKTPR